MAEHPLICDVVQANPSVKAEMLMVIGDREARMGLSKSKAADLLKKLADYLSDDSK